MLKASKQYSFPKHHNFDVFGGPFSRLCRCHSHIVVVDFTLWGFQFTSEKAIVAAIELDFIFQQQPMPSYRSFHFDAYYNSFTQTWEESLQPITPTCFQFTSAFPETLTPPCPTLHYTAFKKKCGLLHEKWGKRGEKNLKSREECTWMCVIYTLTTLW